MLFTQTPLELADRLWMLGSTAYPIYLYRGEKTCTLFEGGIGPMGPLVAEQIDELGLDRAEVRQLVVPHAHPDHVMAVPRLRELFPGIEVSASAAAAKTMMIEKAIGFFSKIDGALSSAMEEAGHIESRHQPAPLVERQIPIDRPLAEGDRIDVDEGVAFEVLATPGHSDCSLSFFEPSRKILVLSDATGYWLPEHEYLWPNYFGNYATYLASIKRLQALEADVLCISHNGAITGAQAVADYFDWNLAQTEAYHARILVESEAGKSPREIGEALGSEIFEMTQLMPLDFFQKNCSLLVKHSLSHAAEG